MRARQTDGTAVPLSMSVQCTKMAAVPWHYVIIYDVTYVNEIRNSSIAWKSHVHAIRFYL